MFNRLKRVRHDEIIVERAEWTKSRLARNSAWHDSLGVFATRLVQLAIVVILLAALMWGMSYLSTITIPMVLAFIFASTFNPLMRWMERKGVPALAATLLALLSILVVLGGIASLVTWAVANQWDDLRRQASRGIDQVVAFVDELPWSPTQKQLDSAQAWVVDFLTSAEFGSGALAGVTVVSNFVTGFVLLIVLLFFFLKDGPKIWAFLCRPFEGESYARARRIGDRTVSTLGSYVRGTATVAAVDAIGIGVGLLILGVPLAIPLAVLVFLLAFIPIVGAVLAGVLAALVALVSNGLVSALIVVGIVVLVNQLEGNLLQPVLMGRAVQLHALAILVALMIGTIVGGVLGAVLSVPVAAVAWGVIQVWEGVDTPARWARPKYVE